MPAMISRSGIRFFGADAAGAVRRPDDTIWHYGRGFIEAGAAVSVVLKVGGVEQVLYSGTLTPDLGKTGIIEVRTRFMPGYDAAKDEAFQAAKTALGKE